MSSLQWCVRSGLLTQMYHAHPDSNVVARLELAYLNEPDEPPIIHNIPLLRRSSFVEYVK